MHETGSTGIRSFEAAHEFLVPQRRAASDSDPLMGTHKQASALVKNINRIRRERFKGDLSPQQVAEYTAEILAMPLTKVQAEFAKYNAITGFDRHESPATAAQRKRISQLEIAAYGQTRTTWITALAFMQASDLIAALIVMRDNATQGVRQAERFANEQRTGANS